ncbi:Rhomboid-domain-containing protein [Balamuthia mandrillaris]
MEAGSNMDTPNKKRSSLSAAKNRLSQLVTDYFSVEDLRNDKSYFEQKMEAPVEDDLAWMEESYWNAAEMQLQNEREAGESAAASAPPLSSDDSDSEERERGHGEVLAGGSGSIYIMEDFGDADSHRAPSSFGSIGPGISLSNKPRGRGRGRGRPRKQAKKPARRFFPRWPLRKKDKTQPRQRPRYWPIFIMVVSLADLIMLIVEIVVNGGFESFSDNPWGGPSAETLIDLGAKWVPAIKDDGEWWRFITPIFLHVGIGHLAMNLLMQLKVGLSLEAAYGWHRVAPIYMLSGVAGNLVSSIFLPQQVTVGASGSLFGFTAVLLTDLISNWTIIKNPIRALIGMILGIMVSLALGLLPGVDNFAHIGGFLEGLMAGFIFLPSIAAKTNKCHFYMRRILLFVCVPLNIGFLVGGFVLFYKSVDPDGWCNGCEVIDCVPIMDWCDF